MEFALLDICLRQLHGILSEEKSLMKKFIFLLGLAAMLSLASCASEPTTSRENTVTQSATTNHR
jgi:uncharacterized lipoprotein YajG